MISAADILKASILIVDDQDANITVLEEMLIGAGYVSVTSTKNPSQVCDLHYKNHYSLIILDLLMPGMDGFQVMEGLKAIETSGYLPVLVQTAQPDHKLRALKSGAKDFVSKPFDLSEVLLRVHNLIEVRLLQLETTRLYDQERKVSEQLLLVFRSGPIAVSIATVASGRIIDANEECCKFYGYSRTELIGNGTAGLNLWANPEDRAPLMERLLNEGAVRGHECKRRLKSGEMRDVLTSLELIEMAAEREPVFISMFIDITERKQAEAQLRETQKRLLMLSRQTGMAEIATNMLHDVNNVLCSVNIASSLLAKSLRNSKAASLSKVVKLLHEHEGDLGAFLTSDPRGKELPGYLATLADELIREQTAALRDLDDLQKSIEHIKHVVTVQQSLAKATEATEIVEIGEVVEEALRMDGGALNHHGVEIVRDFIFVQPVAVVRHKVLQILLNLVRNAKQACIESGGGNQQLTVRVYNGDGRIKIAVKDNGIGIAPENVSHIFKRGFTTKKHGHGFGLHSSATAAKEIGGSLSVHSEGVGQGATFTLELPATS